MLNFRQIEVFRAVMITGTVSGAAQMLNASQPGLSRMLKYLEDRLGFRLFDRTAGRLLPTHEARILFAEIQTIYKGIESLDQVTRRLAAGDDQVFKLGASPSLGHSVVPRLLRELSDRSRGLILQTDILSVEQMPEYLTQGRGEYGLTVYRLDNPALEATQLGNAKMVCVVPADHPLADAGRVSLRQLTGEHVISFRSDTHHGRAVTEMFAAAAVDMEISTFVRFAETAVAFVQGGLGIAFVDEFSARGFGAHVARTLELEEDVSLPIFLLRNRHAPRSVISDVFEKITKAAFGSYKTAHK